MAASGAAKLGVGVPGSTHGWHPRLGRLAALLESGLGATLLLAASKSTQCIIQLFVAPAGCYTLWRERHRAKTKLV